MATKQQQRERAERRRKLEEFWRWVIGERPDCFSDQLNSLPGLCMQAVFIVESELIAMQQEGNHEMLRDLSLAQLDVLEMLEERVSEVSHDEPAVKHLDSSAPAWPVGETHASDDAVDASQFQTEYLCEWAEKSMEIARRDRDDRAERMREMYLAKYPAPLPKKSVGTTAAEMLEVAKRVNEQLYNVMRLDDAQARSVSGVSEMHTTTRLSVEPERCPEGTICVKYRDVSPLVGQDDGVALESGRWTLSPKPSHRVTGYDPLSQSFYLERLQTPKVAITLQKWLFVSHNPRPGDYCRNDPSNNWFVCDAQLAKYKVVDVGKNSVTVVDA